MRLGRLVAAGLVAGAVTGFVGALLRPRTVNTYGDPHGPLGAAPGEVLTAAAPAASGLEPAAPAPHIDLDAAAASGSAAAAPPTDGTTEERGRRVDVDGDAPVAAAGQVRRTAD